MAVWRQSWRPAVLEGPLLGPAGSGLLSPCAGESFLTWASPGHEQLFCGGTFRWWCWTSSGLSLGWTRELEGVGRAVICVEGLGVQSHNGPQHGLVPTYPTCFRMWKDVQVFSNIQLLPAGQWGVQKWLCGHQADAPAELLRAQVLVSWVSNVMELSLSFLNTELETDFRIYFMFIQVQCDRANAIWNSIFSSENEVCIYLRWTRLSHLISIASIRTFWAASTGFVIQE